MTDGAPVGGSSSVSRFRRPRPTAAERRAARSAVDDPALVLAAAARFLEVRARSVAEVRRRLGEAGYQPRLIEAAIDRLLELGLLDDEAFARGWVGARDRSRPRGSHALRSELRAKGIASETVEMILAERDAATAPDVEGSGGIAARRDGAGAGQRGPRTLPRLRDGATDGGGDLVAAGRLLERHRPSLARVADPRRRRQRAYALLARNGFGPDVIAVVIGGVESAAMQGLNDDDGGGSEITADPET